MMKMPTLIGIPYVFNVDRPSTHAIRRNLLVKLEMYLHMLAPSLFC